MLKYIVGFGLIVHGLAHISGLLGLLTSGTQAFPDKAWLFSEGVTARGTFGKAFSLVWLVALVGLIAAGAGLVLGQSWWPTVSVVAAGASLLAIVPWLRAVPPGAWAGGVLDLLILMALLGPWAERIVEALG
jgi:hypothetical protein